MNWYDQNVKNDFYKKLADSTVLHTCIYNENGNYTVSIDNNMNLDMIYCTALPLNMLASNFRWYSSRSIFLAYSSCSILFNPY